MWGSATFTTVASRTSMSWASMTSQRPMLPARRADGAIPAGARVAVVDVMEWCPVLAEGLTYTKRRDAPVKTIRRHSPVCNTSLREVSVRADAQRNRDRIVEVARTLFRARGFDAVSMDEVAKGAGVGPGTLYRHLPTKESL